MRELHGVTVFPIANLSQLKPLLFSHDALHLVDRMAAAIRFSAHELADLDFLTERGVLDHTNPPDILKMKASFSAQKVSSNMQRSFDRAGNEAIRMCVAKLTIVHRVDAVPIYKGRPPKRVMFGEALGQSIAHRALKITQDYFPQASVDCPWQDIIDFKEEAHDKLWRFRRFLHTLATKEQTEAEIRDDIGWSVNEYAKAMDRLKIKRSIGFMETYIIPTVEALEALKPSSFLKGLVGIKKRKLELYEGVEIAPGREVAYIYDAQKRFGNS